MSHIPATHTLVHRAVPLDWDGAKALILSLELEGFDGYMGEVEGVSDQLDELMTDIVPSADGAGSERLLVALRQAAVADLDVLAAELDGEEWDRLDVGGYVVRQTPAGTDVASESLLVAQRLDEIPGVLDAAGFLGSEEYRQPIEVDPMEIRQGDRGRYTELLVELPMTFKEVRSGDLVDDDQGVRRVVNRATHMGSGHYELELDDGTIRKGTSLTKLLVWRYRGGSYPEATEVLVADPGYRGGFRLVDPAQAPGVVAEVTLVDRVGRRYLLDIRPWTARGMVRELTDWLLDLTKEHLG
jgi:hypothetical protein